MEFGELVRREWGAVSFIVTVLIGIVVVPVALALNGPKISNATLAGSEASGNAVPAVTSPAPVSPAPSVSPAVSATTSPGTSPTP